MSELEKFERYQARLLNMRYEDLKTQFDHHLKVFGNRYAAFSDFEKEWELWQAAWKPQQSEIDQLKTELALCREENKGLVKSLNDEKSRINKTLSILKGFWVKDGNPNFVVVVDAEKALRGDHESTN